MQLVIIARLFLLKPRGFKKEHSESHCGVQELVAGLMFSIE